MFVWAGGLLAQPARSRYLRPLRPAGRPLPHADEGARLPLRDVLPGLLAVRRGFDYKSPSGIMHARAERDGRPAEGGGAERA